MAKVQVNVLVQDHHYFTDPFNDMHLGEHSKKQAILNKLDGSEDYIVIHGKNLSYSSDGSLNGGTITSVEFKNEIGINYATLDDVDFSIRKKLTLDTGYSLAFSLLNGNDTIKGSFGDDILFGINGVDTMKGFEGRDLLISGDKKTTMTGGEGSDYFFFGVETKTAIVKDFDAIGGGFDQDYFYFGNDPDSVKIQKDHNDTVLNFGHGHKMILLDVDRSDVSMDDFLAPSFPF